VLLRFSSLPPVFRSATRSPTKRLRESVYPLHRGQLGVGDYHLSRCNRTKTNHRLLAIEASRKATPWPKPAVAVKPIGERRLSVRAPNVQATAGSSARRRHSQHFEPDQEMLISFTRRPFAISARAQWYARTSRLDPHQTRRQRGEERHHLLAPDRYGHHHRTGGVDAVNFWPTDTDSRSQNFEPK
jgi:hypothetical protein